VLAHFLPLKFTPTRGAGYLLELQTASVYHSEAHGH
jgi:hypothetical protein